MSARSKTKVVVVSTSENTASVSTFKLSLDFKNPATSALSTSGKLRIANTQPIANVTVNVSIPGSSYTQDFVLDAKGAGGNATSLFTLKGLCVRGEFEHRQVHARVERGGTYRSGCTAGI